MQHLDAELVAKGVHAASEAARCGEPPAPPRLNAAGALWIASAVLLHLLVLVVAARRAHGFVDDLMRAALQAISDGRP